MAPLFSLFHCQLTSEELSIYTHLYYYLAQQEIFSCIMLHSIVFIYET